MNIPTVNEMLSPQAFYILLALTDKTLHGYGIRNQVAYDSQSTIVMAPGTVYIILNRLVAEGMVRRVIADDLRPKIVCRYELTKLGAIRLKSEIARLEQITQQARYKLAAQGQF